MNKFFVVVCILVALTTQLSAETLENEFNKMSLSERVNVQANLKQLGYYDSSIDGVWGPGTEGGILGFGRSIANSEEGTMIDNGSLLSQLLYLELDNEGADSNALLGQDTSSSSSPSVSGMPAWLVNITALSGNATIGDWATSSRDVKVRTSANYYGNSLSDDSLDYMISSGLLLSKSIEVASCMDEIIQFGMQTNQMVNSKLLFPDIATGCLVATSFPSR